MKDKKKLLKKLIKKLEKLKLCKLTAQRDFLIRFLIIIKNSTLRQIPVAELRNKLTCVKLYISMTQNQEALSDPKLKEMFKDNLQLCRENLKHFVNYNKKETLC